MTTTKKTTKTKKNPMKVIGKTIKDTFIEMSESLAGWIDDTGTQFTNLGKSKKNKTKSSTSNMSQNSEKMEKPKPEN